MLYSRPPDFDPDNHTPVQLRRLRVLRGHVERGEVSDFRFAHASKHAQFLIWWSSYKRPELT